MHCSTVNWVRYRLGIVIGYAIPNQSSYSVCVSAPQMADFMVGEIVGEGIGESGVRCGLIGEMGCSWPLTGNERRSLEAAALAQRETGAPLIIHPGRDERSPFEILDVLEAAGTDDTGSTERLSPATTHHSLLSPFLSGADISRTVMSHLDRTIFEDSKLLEFARRGCYLEYDFFGIECSHYQVNIINFVVTPRIESQVPKMNIQT